MKKTKKKWTLPKDLQRPDWEPGRNGGSVRCGDYEIHGMTCADAKLIVRAVNKQISKP